MLVYLLILAAFLADRLSKRWALGYLGENGATAVHPLLTISETYNEGIALGLFQGIGPIVGWLTLFVLAGLLVFLTRVPHEQRLLRCGIALVIGGGLGNLVDRISAGQVLDFLTTPLLPSVFNVADILVYCGVGMILIAIFVFDQHGAQRLAAESAEPH